MFGWSESDPEKLEQYNIPHTKIDLANQYRDREIFLFDLGSKQTTESIIHDSRVSNADQLPIEYYQSNYGTA